MYVSALYNRVITDKGLFTKICEYISNDELKLLFPQFRKYVYYYNIEPYINTLIYGQVQSGKTQKIVNYIKYFRPDMKKIIVMQNMTSMINQYIRVFKDNNITYKCVCAGNINKYNDENVILILHNKFRIASVTKFLSVNNINSYCLVMDESDQYYNNIKNTSVYLNSKHRLHITATPYIYHKVNMDFDKIVMINPPTNYVGINNINIRRMYSQKYKNNDWDDKYVIKKNIIVDVISKDFITKDSGTMLITVYTRIMDMNAIANTLSRLYQDVPVVVLSSYLRVYVNGNMRVNKKMSNIQKIIDEFANNKHVILLANRLANRGINYTNSTYTRFITHQIAQTNTSPVSFIQKCRIFGKRNAEPEMPNLYCVDWNNNFDKYMEKIKNSINHTFKNTNYIVSNNQYMLGKKTMKQLIALCKENNIKKYSSLKKSELVELLDRSSVKIT